MSYKKVDEIVVENARIIFRNFTGEEKKFNRAGDRNFCVIIDDPDMAQKLIEDGWNIRALAPREEGDLPTHYLPIKVAYNNYPPTVYLVTMLNGKMRNKVSLDEESISLLDKADLVSADLTIRPYCWDVNGKEGIAAYLKTGYFVIEEDVLAAKYDQNDSNIDLPF